MNFSCRSRIPFHLFFSQLHGCFPDGGGLVILVEPFGKDEANAAVGALIAENASVSGAEGGCQAEVGTAAAMAAAALAQMLGGTPDTCLDAASLCIANMLGLVCDPVRGLVEYPCQLRNASGVANAMSAAQLSCSGVTSPLPFDEVVEAMRQVGEALPPSLRETALGGLAAAPSASTACAHCGGCA